jgi:hypothetical protein
MRFALRDLNQRRNDIRFYRTGWQNVRPRYSFDGTKVAWGWAVGAPPTDSDIYYGSVTFNHPPAFTGYSANDQETEACVEFSRLLSATDPDGEAVTFALAMAPPGCSLVGGNRISWVPTQDQVGDHYLVLRARDGSGGVDNRVVKLSVVDIGWCENPPCPPGHHCYPVRNRPVDDKRLPTVFALAQSQPNPFRSTTSIHFDLPVATPVVLDVIDVQGRLVRRLVDGEFQPGFYEAVWDRVDGHGSRVGPGVYFYRIRAGSFAERKKMILLP